MKRRYALIVIPGFCLGIVVLPWLVFAVTSLVGPVFVIGSILFLGWCLGRKAEPVDVSMSRRIRERARQRQPIERMQERLLQVVHSNGENDHD